MSTPGFCTSDQISGPNLGTPSPGRKAQPAVLGPATKLAIWSLWHQGPSQRRLSPNRSYCLYQTGAGAWALEVLWQPTACSANREVLLQGLLRSCHLGSRQLLASIFPTQPGWLWCKLVGATKILSFNISRKLDRRKIPSPALPLRPPLLAAHPAPSDLLNGERGRCLWAEPRRGTGCRRGAATSL